ncbi:MAG: TerB family tellurite resistance protein [Polyangiaceae bacterium]|nr:TerB family tellurite resistance protein [Polyangiaceae bacterium]
MFSPVKMNGEESKSIMRALIVVAKADGVLDAREAGLLAAFWSDVDGDYAEVGRLEDAASITPQELAVAIGRHELRVFFLETAWYLSMMDGRVSENERNSIDAFREALEVSTSECDEIEKKVIAFLSKNLPTQSPRELEGA